MRIDLGHRRLDGIARHDVNEGLRLQDQAGVRPPRRAGIEDVVPDERDVHRADEDRGPIAGEVVAADHDPLGDAVGGVLSEVDLRVARRVSVERTIPDDEADAEIGHPDGGPAVIEIASQERRRAADCAKRFSVRRIEPDEVHTAKI
ncbi:hypothetical protein OMR07_06570 [Methylobacterium organophilum]|nr:hypothetical protein [Methylobacterium organophilum]